MIEKSPDYHYGSYVISSVMEINHQGSWIRIWGDGGFWKVFITHSENRPTQLGDTLLNVKLRESPIDSEKRQGIARIYQWVHHY